MTRISFQHLTFEEHGSTIRCRLFHRYFFDLERDALERVGRVSVQSDALDVEASEKRVRNKILPLLEDGMTWRLVHQLYKKPAFYIREELDIPLIGATEIGVADRGSNILEVKPVTGCNLNCTFCSVDEGRNKKQYDYLVEKEYLVKVVARLAARKEHPVEVNIGPHGEPLLYPQLVELVRDLKALPNVAIISLNTNGTLLSKRLIDELATAGLTRINLSLHALDPALAARMAGVQRYPLNHILEMVAYAKEQLNVLLAPVLVPGLNEKELPKLVELSKSIKSAFPTIGIQNYLAYPKGRKGAKKPLSWKAFFHFLDELERQSGKRLRATQEAFHIYKEEALPKPFRKGDIVRVKLCMPGRYPHEMYGKAKGRLVNVQIENRLENIGKELPVRIVREKHNIFKGVPRRAV